MKLIIYSQSQCLFTFIPWNFFSFNSVFFKFIFYVLLNEVKLIFHNMRVNEVRILILFLFVYKRFIQHNIRTVVNGSIIHESIYSG